MTPVERQAFEAHYKHLDLTTEKDAWGRDRYKHQCVDAIWTGWQVGTLAERARAAAVCTDEVRIRKEAALQHPENSAARDRCMAAARAAANCAMGVSSGEIVEVLQKTQPVI